MILLRIPGEKLAMLNLQGSGSECGGCFNGLTNKGVLKMELSNIMIKAFNLGEYSIENLKSAYNREKLKQNKNKSIPQNYYEIFQYLYKNGIHQPYVKDDKTMGKQQEPTQLASQDDLFNDHAAYLNRYITESETDKMLRTIEKYKPNATMSIFYKIIYAKTIWKLVYYDNNNINKLEIIPLFSRPDDEIKKLLAECINFGIDENTYYITQFCAQLMYFKLLRHDYHKKTNRTDPIKYLAFIFVDIFLSIKKEPNPDTVFIAMYGLTAPLDGVNFEDAFNYLGLCASDYDLQLAYDVYYSWIHRKVVGLLHSKLSEKEIDLLNKKLKKTHESAIMYMNYSYVCGTIANTYNKKNKKWYKFHNLALESIEYADTIAKTNTFLKGDISCTYATLLCDNKEIDFNKVINLYQFYYSLCDTNDKQEAQEMIIETQMQWLFFSYYDNVDEFDKWLDSKEIDIMKTEVVKRVNNIISSLKDYENNQNWKALYSIIALLKESDNNIKFIALLLLVSYCCNELREQLKRREYSKIDYIAEPSETSDSTFPQLRNNVPLIAYYTTLSNFCHIFDELVCGPNDCAPRIASDQESTIRKNCFTVMHAKYMNDPQEGVALFNAILKVISNGTNNLFSNFTSETFRESIYQQKFVFLKSFTESIDTLHMWNRYASDRSSGKDSNGCCAIVNPSSFGKKITFPQEDKERLPLYKNNKDDLYLYQVVYLDNKGKIINKKNISSKVESLYEVMLNLFKLLNIEYNKILKSISDSTEKEKIQDAMSDYLRETLQHILFLFKAGQYSDECESRIVLTRYATESQLKSIRLLSTTPQKLCLNPFNQVLIDEVIFGPNIQNAIDTWGPYIQYELIKMWKKSDGGIELGQEVHKKYNIWQSKLPYRN